MDRAERDSFPEAQFTTQKRTQHTSIHVFAPYSDFHILRARLEKYFLDLSPNKSVSKR